LEEFWNDWLDIGWGESMTIHMKCCVKFVLAKMNTVGLAIGTWQGQVRPGITLRRLQRDGYLSTNCIIVSCRNFRVLKKASLYFGKY
jgi:hypothetical protein